MRQAVISYECGTGRKRRPVAKVPKRKATAGAEVGAEAGKPDKKAPPVVGKAQAVVGKAPPVPGKAPKADKAAASGSPPRGIEPAQGFARMRARLGRWPMPPCPCRLPMPPFRARPPRLGQGPSGTSRRRAYQPETWSGCSCAAGHRRWGAGPPCAWALAAVLTEVAQCLRSRRGRRRRWRRTCCRACDTISGARTMNSGWQFRVELDTDAHRSGCHGCGARRPPWHLGCRRRRVFLDAAQPQRRRRPQLGVGQCRRQSAPPNRTAPTRASGARLHALTQ